MKISSLNLFNRHDRIAWVGAGGKTSLLFAIANELFPSKCIVTTTTKMAISEINQAQNSIQTNSMQLINQKNINGICLVYKELEKEESKISGFANEELEHVTKINQFSNIPILIEADGSKRKPIKFPAEHEPNIPSFVNKVCVVVGLSSIGKPLSREYFHRPELISNFLRINLGEKISWDHLYAILIDSSGGLKNIPENAEKILFLNQSDVNFETNELNNLALKLKNYYDHILLCHINDGNLIIDAHWGKIGCVILAAGSSSRFGSPKQLAHYKGKSFIETIIDTSLKVSFSERLVVLGFAYETILKKIYNYDINIINNQDWEAGQSESVKLGVNYLIDKNVNAILFLLVDQPQITTSMINKVIIEFAYNKPNIIVHDYLGQNRHPILFSHKVFQDLLKIKGDKGGRQLFDKYSPKKIELSDDYLAIDVDTYDDLKKLS